MNEREFVYWFNGYLELSETNTLTEHQVKIIKEHLGLVMQKVTELPHVIAPAYPPPIGTGGPVIC